MGIRGRKSAAALAIVNPEGFSVIPRPNPPEELSDEQAHEWRAIVNRMAGDWFPRETHGMLAQYCRHVVAARRVAQLVTAYEAQEPLDVEAYDRLLKMQEREGRAISSLATRMRLSQHSSYDHKKVKPTVTLKNPWDEDPED